MKTITITSGLDVPISGTPIQQLGTQPKIKHVAILADDYIGMKPTMHCKVGDKVKTGQRLFTDKKNKGIVFTAPNCGEVVEINRGEKRKFESVVICLQGEDKVKFLDPASDDQLKSYPQQQIIETLIQSGLWTSFRTRPFGKNPAIDTAPAALFITASETTPLAPSPEILISLQKKEFEAGLSILEKGIEASIHLCSNADQSIPCIKSSKIQEWAFAGPHPAGLASTHIHMIAPVDESHIAWQISYQDVINIGHLFLTGSLSTEKVIAISGPSVLEPTLMKVPIGAAIDEISAGHVTDGPNRFLSGSVLDGRIATGFQNYLGKFHNQVSVLPDDSGRSLFNWMTPGATRFSTTPVFSSALKKGLQFILPTATWGGHRAIFPLGTYEKVMPLDIIATSLLKSIAVGDTEKAKALGALELIEEDLALCSFVCPGKNNFGPMLRETLSTIEREG